jgi:hypothetical protein
MNTMVVKALQYARTMTANVEAFHVEIYPGEGDKLRNKWAARLRPKAGSDKGKI